MLDIIINVIGWVKDTKTLFNISRAWPHDEFIQDACFKRDSFLRTRKRVIRELYHERYFYDQWKKYRSGGDRYGTNPFHYSECDDLVGMTFAGYIWVHPVPNMYNISMRTLEKLSDISLMYNIEFKPSKVGVLEIYKYAWLKRKDVARKSLVRMFMNQGIFTASDSDEFDI